MPSNDYQFMEQNGRAAMIYVLDIMDGLTGGAFQRGYREATAVERIMEWDALTAEQMAMLRERQGDEWLLQQGGAIEKLRKQVDTGAPGNVQMAV